MSKSDDTRQRITDVAIASFKERGYEQTTLRLIAKEAGLSVGNAYYYFPTKTHIVQELYLQVQLEHASRARPLLAGEDDLTARLGTVFGAGLDTLAPYHSTAPGFLSAMIAPGSAINPLSDESDEARGVVIGLFREAVEGSANRVPDFLRERLPELMWFAYLGLALYFVYDSSPEQVRSRRLLTRSMALFRTILPLARLPFARGPLIEVLDIMDEARS